MYNLFFCLLNGCFLKKETNMCLCKQIVVYSRKNKTNYQQIESEMNKIVSKEHFSANVVKLEVEAPLIARSRKAGHFVIVR